MPISKALIMERRLIKGHQCNVVGLQAGKQATCRYMLYYSGPKLMTSSISNGDGAVTTFLTSLKGFNFDKKL